MADAEIKGTKGSVLLPPQIYGPLGALTPKVQHNCQEGQASTHEILAPFWIFCGFQRHEGQEGQNLWWHSYRNWRPCFLSRPPPFIRTNKLQNARLVCRPLPDEGVRRSSFATFTNLMGRVECIPKGCSTAGVRALLQ
jgi:hypothetical protein